MLNLDQFSSCQAAILEFIQRGGRSSPQENEADFNRLALASFRLQWDSIPAYRQACGWGNVSIDSVRSWYEIPSVPTVAFKELELTSIPESERVAVFHSSGTTGSRPSRHHHSTSSLSLYEASLLEGFSASMLSSSERKQDAAGAMNLGFFSLCPPPAAAVNSSLSHMMGFVARTCHWSHAQFFGVVDSMGAWCLDLVRLIQALERVVRSGQPVVMTGTAFLWVHLLDFLGRSGRSFQLPPGSRVMETGGYKGRSRVLPKDQLHSLIGRGLGLPQDCIICEYGMSELGSQAYDAVDGLVPAGDRRFAWPHWVRFLIISPENGSSLHDGSPGLLRIFDLANSRSVLAVQTEDLALRSGCRFELLGRLQESEPRGCSLRSN